MFVIQLDNALVLVKFAYYFRNEITFYGNSVSSFKLNNTQNDESKAHSQNFQNGKPCSFFLGEFFLSKWDDF